MSTVADTTAAGSAPGVGSGGADGPPPPEHTAETSLARTLQQIARSDLLVVVMSFVFAFLIGSVLIVIANEQVRQSLTYFFARPGDTLTAIWEAVTGAYGALLRGALFDNRAFTRTAESVREAGGSGMYVLLPALGAGLRPLTETLTVATPLIIAAAGMAVSFRAGLFNIGGTGQLIAGTMAAAFVGFALPLPTGVHLLAALIAGVVAGGVWGGIAGFLKARFGANEVISTIMLNWIATYLLFFSLKTELFTGASSGQPTSFAVRETALLPKLLGDGFRLHAGLLVVAIAVALLWWLMSRSTLGFHFRAVGSNPRAAQVAGISPTRTAFLVLAVAGALVGLAGAVHVLGTERRLTEGIAGNIGFDAITVALLGRSGPIGIVLAGLLFAGLSTGGRLMETSQGVPLDLVQVIQVLVVLFIAAPPLVRTLIGLRRVDNPQAGGRGRRRRGDEPAAATNAAGGSVAITSDETDDTTADDDTAREHGPSHRADPPGDPDPADPCSPSDPVDPQQEEGR